MRREPEVPEEKVPVVECIDGPARITSKELLGKGSSETSTRSTIMQGAIPCQRKSQNQGLGGKQDLPPCKKFRKGTCESGRIVIIGILPFVFFHMKGHGSPGCKCAFVHRDRIRRTAQHPKKAYEA